MSCRDVGEELLHDAVCDEQAAAGEAEAAVVGIQESKARELGGAVREEGCGVVSGDRSEPVIADAVGEAEHLDGRFSGAFDG